MKKYEKIFQENGGVAQMRTLQEGGLTYYKLHDLLEKGTVTRIKQGVYRLEDGESPVDEMVVVARMVPKGVYCLFSAWHYHDLSTYIPHEHHLAIEKSTKVRLPDFPPCKLYFRDKTNYELGILDTGMLRVYDLEKSVCDAVKYRNKTGMDTLNEVLKNYLKRRDKNLDRLLKYANLMRVEQILNNYLLMLL